MFFTSEKIEQLNSKYAKINHAYQEILLNYLSLHSQLKDKKAKEYIRLGFLNRLGVLRRCLLNIWTICPPENTKKLSDEALENLSINLHSFIFNIYGCSDNLAWIWVKEKDLPIPRTLVGLGSKCKKVRDSFSQDFQDHLIEIDSHFEQLENFRHALAHRIPLFVCSQILNKQEAINYQNLQTKMIDAALNQPLEEFKKFIDTMEDMGKFAPIMTHSFEENSPQVPFHKVIVNFWETIIDTANKFFRELKNLNNNQIFKKL
ncbi:MAG: hypothetical protein IPP67_03520 [Rhodospirillaceae bacterium]|nr:hypothetical protein [Rhodospirillaceae bacterium]